MIVIAQNYDHMRIIGQFGFTNRKVRTQKLGFQLYIIVGCDVLWGHIFTMHKLECIRDHDNFIVTEQNHN